MTSLSLREYLELFDVFPREGSYIAPKDKGDDRRFQVIQVRLRNVVLKLM